MEFPDSDFWNYSSQLWTLPAVESACLELQNSHDLDVNLVLYCCWCGDHQRRLSEDDMQTLIDAMKHWHTVIKPLRESRQMLKQNLIAMPSEMIEQTLQKVSDMELNAEHMAQIELEKALPVMTLEACSSHTSVECSLSNLKLYTQAVDTPPPPDVLTPKLSQLLNSIYQDEEAVQLAFMTSMVSS